MWKWSTKPARSIFICFLTSIFLFKSEFELITLQDFLHNLANLTCSCRKFSFCYWSFFSFSGYSIYIWVYLCTMTGFHCRSRQKRTKMYLILIFFQIVFFPHISYMENSFVKCTLEILNTLALTCYNSWLLIQLFDSLVKMTIMCGKRPPSIPYMISQYLLLTRHLDFIVGKQYI